MTLFVAEIGLNHNGSFDLARELVREAKLAGADIAKFQFGWRDGEGEMNQIDLDRARWLKAWCDYLDIEFMASVITPEAFEMAKEVGMDRYKIASRTVKEYPDLCEEILAMGNETFISLGMWDEEEFPFGPPDEKRLRYLYCVSNYPTYPADLGDFPDAFGPDGYYGYSDHTLGLQTCMLALARGARYIEKHFTLDKSSQVIHDHVLSATPDEFRQLTDLGGAVARLQRTLSEESPEENSGATPP